MEGKFVESPGPKQPIEFLCSSVKVLGSCDLAAYPLSGGQKYDPNRVRQHYHLRSKTSHFNSFLRVRQSLVNNVHGFFQGKGFIHVDTPVITGTDCEGAGEAFDIATSANSSAQFLLDVTDGSETSTDSDSDADESDIENDQRYFRRHAHLTVSSQLHLEAACSGVKQVYCVSPVFRAERNVTRQHLSELYMVEAEMAFVDSIARLMEIVQQFVTSMAEKILHFDSEDLLKCLEYHNSDMKVIERIAGNQQFAQLDYSDAIEILARNKADFAFEPRYGHSLKKEHENFLVHHCGSQPVFIINFPVACKPFYMLANSDRPTTAACFDLLVPGCGEVCGGSLRENNYDELKKKMEIEGLDMRTMKWYLELRRFGYPPMGGFGIGLERYIMYLLGIFNIKDTIPFPRWYRNCKM